MIRAIVKNGTIHPLEHIPPEWSDGWSVMPANVFIGRNVCQALMTFGNFA